MFLFCSILKILTSLTFYVFTSTIKNHTKLLPIIYLLLFSWFKNEYNNPEVIVTENGWSDDGEIQDDGRISYLKVDIKN